MTKELNDIRLENLKLLSAVVGSKKELSKLAGVSQNYMYQVERRKTIGVRVCNAIEAGLSLPIGWMDVPQTTSTYLDSVHSKDKSEKQMPVIDKKMLTECIADALCASDEDTPSEVIAMVAATLYINKHAIASKDNNNAELKLLSSDVQ